MDVFDGEAALDNVGGDAELLVELVAVFEEEYPPLVEAIRAGIVAGDSERIRNAAHSIKGAISPFAAKPAYDVASQLEQAAAAGELSDASERLTHLEAEITRLCQALRTECG